MVEISQKQQKILGIFLKNGDRASSVIHRELQKTGERAALVTIKRELSKMVDSGLLTTTGSGPATVYAISTLGRVSAEVDAKTYVAIEPDGRYGLRKYNFRLFSELPADIFLESEMQTLEEATRQYHRRTAGISDTIQKKELERLVIELAWKSSKIEGNTYNLFDTEKLILKNKEAAGHSRDEARMILNHKDAFTFAHEHKAAFKTLTRANMKQLHGVLVKGLRVGGGLRKKPVGVLGSTYQPLDNIHQITDAIETLSGAVTRMDTPYARALIALLGISYIQPFDDGNKRTSRLMAGALLMAYGLAPLSYRSVDEHEYREAMLVFYELNSLVPFKKIFIGQYDFAARNYAVR